VSVISTLAVRAVPRNGAKLTGTVRQARDGDEESPMRA